MGDVPALSSSTRTNLLSLQRTTGLIGRTQERLASGLKVNSAIDDALAFFKARNLNARASDLSSVKDDITNGFQAGRIERAQDAEQRSQPTPIVINAGRLIPVSVYPDLDIRALWKHRVELPF